MCISATEDYSTVKFEKIQYYNRYINYKNEAYENYLIAYFKTNETRTTSNFVHYSYFCK